MNITTETGFVITDVTWYTPQSGECIGLVKGHNDFEEKYYIGVGYGHDEEHDALKIAREGARFYPFIFQEAHGKSND